MALSSVSEWQKRLFPAGPFPQKECPSQVAGFLQSRWILQVRVLDSQYSLAAQVVWTVTICGWVPMQEQKVDMSDGDSSVNCLKRMASLDGRPWSPRH